MNINRRLLVVTGVAFLLSAFAHGEEPRRVTQADLLGRLIDMQRLCLPTAPGEKPGLVSGESKRAAEWRPIATLEGPGAVTRLWFDRLEGGIRIKVDGETIAEKPLNELLGGALEPFQFPLVNVPAPTTAPTTAPAADRGISSYVPIGFARQCEIQLKDAATAFEVSHVRFDKSLSVEPFSMPLNEAGQAAVRRVSGALLRGLSDRDLNGDQRPMPVAVQQDVGPDEKLTESLDGDGVVRGLFVALTDKSDPREPYALHRLIVRIFVDGEKEPSVEAPLSALFGSGFELEQFNGIALGTYKDLRIPLPDRRFGQDRFMFLTFPMPYRSGLQVEIENLNKRKKPIGLLLIMNVDTRAPAEGAMRFFARYRSESPAAGDAFTLLDAAGGGRLVGCTLLVDMPRRAWWGAGSLHAKVDGAELNGVGGALLGAQADGATPAAFPFHGVVRAGSFGKSAGYRLFVSDAIDFAKSLSLSLGLPAEKRDRDAFFGVVTYWYGAPPKAGLFARLVEAGLKVPGFRLPNTVEVEGNIRTPNWGNPVKEEFTGVELSGGIAASISLEQPVEINIPSERERTVMLKLRTVPGRPFEKLTVTDPAGKVLASLDYARVPNGIFELGRVTLKAGDNLFRVQCVRSAMLDCWILDEP